MADARDVCARAESLLRPLFRQAAEAGWAVNVEATAENEARMRVAETAVSDTLADAELFAEVVAARGATSDPLLARELEVLHATLLGSQAPASLRHRIVELESAVDSTFARHRAVVDGRALSENDVVSILRRSDDVDVRRAAWVASKSVGAVVADDVRELARLRNAVARGLGHRDWFALGIATQELNEERLLATLAACDTATVGPFVRWKADLDVRLATRFGCDPADLRPWHYADPFFQEVPVEGGVDVDPFLGGQDAVDLARRTFDGFGLDTAAILSRSDLYPRDAKCQQAFCLDIDRAGDVRVLANVVDDAYWAGGMLHELGHATYDAGIDPELPYLLRTTHLVATEGIAILMGALTRDPDWLRRVAGVAPEATTDVAARLRASHVAEQLVFTRWVLVMTGFERALYADPDGDLDTIWWELVEHHQRVTPPETPPAGAWAAKVHIACAPVYYHTYLYGHLVAAQLRATLDRELGGVVGRTEVGELLVERVFRPGESVRWDRLIEEATGEPLAVSFLEAELAGA